MVSGVEIFLDLAEKTDSVQDVERLRKELEVVSAQVDRLEKLLASDFATKAPPAVVEKERAKLREFIETRDKLKAQIAYDRQESRSLFLPCYFGILPNNRLINR